MKGTAIQWTDDTVNPTSGCDGCELWTPGIGGPCYAGNLHETRLAKSLPLLYDSNFSNVRLLPGRMEKILRCEDLAGKDRPARKGMPSKPWLDGLRRKIFVGDLADIFSKDVPFDYLKSEIFDRAVDRFGSRHDLLLLTKQPGRAAEFADFLVKSGMDWPRNVWIGTSITTKASLGRVIHLARIPARIRFLSMEPQREDIALPDAVANAVSWIIVGGESCQNNWPATEFKLEWARRTILFGQRTDVPVFVKQLGGHATDDNKALPGDDHGGDWSLWPDDVRVRQIPGNGDD